MVGARSCARKRPRTPAQRAPENFLSSGYDLELTSNEAVAKVSLMDATHSPRPAADTTFSSVLFPRRSLPITPEQAEARATEAARRAKVVAAHWTGAKHVEGRTLKEIKALISADMKALVKALPTAARFRCSISIPSYSMANELRIKVTLPYAVSCESRPVGDTFTRYTPEAFAVVEAVRTIANAYNYDRSDLATDYVDEEFGLRIVAKQVSL